MKVNSMDRAFTPVKLEITFETQQELDVFGALFNTVPIAQYARKNGIDVAAIYNTIQRLGGNVSDVTPIFDHLKKHFTGE